MDVDETLAAMRPQIRRMAYRYAPLSTDDRDDLCQVGMEAAWLAWRSFDGTGGVEGWMAQKAKWAMVDHLRVSGPVSRYGTRRQAWSLDAGDGVAEEAFAVPDGGAGPERAVVARDELARVRVTVTGMPYREAEALLADRAGREAIMARDGVGEAAVSMRRAKALRVLRSAA